MIQAIDIDDAVKEAFSNIKMNSTHQYMICSIENKEKVVLESLGELGATWEEFCSKLPETEGRFCVFDYKKVMDDGRHINKLCFVFWCPDAAKITAKMVYSSNKVHVGQVFDCGINVACHDKSDLEREEIERHIK